MSDKKVLGSSTITRNFQVTVPRKVRAQFKFKEGDLVVFITEDGRLFIEKG